MQPIATHPTPRSLIWRNDTRVPPQKEKARKRSCAHIRKTYFCCKNKSLQVSPHVYTYMRKHVYVYIYIDTLYPSFCCFQLPMPWHKATPWRICTGTPSTLLTSANLGLDVSDGDMG